jgi:uncharacterized membrane protein YbhN (UPF0104 family)
LKPTRILQVLVSLVLLGVLVRWIDVGAFAAAVGGADPALLGLALALALADRLLMAVKWNLLLGAKRIRLRWTEAVRVYWSSTFLGLFLPSTVGADVVRAVVLSRSESRRADVVSSILVERFLGLVALALFGVAGAALAPLALAGAVPDRGRLLGAAVGAAVAVIGGLAFSFTPAAGRLVDAAAERARGTRLVGRAAEVLAKVYRSFHGYREHRGVLGAFLALSLLENLLPIVRAYLVARALHADVSFVFFAAIVPLELLLIRLPLTVDGFGLREGLFTWFLAKVGVPGSLGFAVGLVNHVLFLLAVVPGGVMHFAGSAGRGPRRPAGEGAAPLDQPGR